MTAVAEWFARESSGAPEALTARAARYLDRQPAGAGVPEALAEAAAAALREAVGHGGDRSVALDLLAADALVTLALKAKAERAPGELAGFAAGLREGGVARR